MLEIKTTKQFRKDLKTAVKRGCPTKKLQKVVDLLAEEKGLPRKYRDHNLKDTPEYDSVRECHIEPDWLLVYRAEQQIQVLRLIRTGTHSDLFNK